MKDHEIAQTVNQLRDIAKEYGQTQQLRERIAAVIVPILARQQDERGALEWALFSLIPVGHHEWAKRHREVFERLLARAAAQSAQEALTDDARKNLLSHADDMDAYGWKDDAKALRALLAATQPASKLTERIDHIDDAGYVHWKEKK